MSRLPILLALCALAAACRSDSAHLKAMHRTSMNDVRERGLLAGVDPDYVQRQAARIEETRAIVERGGVESAEDNLYAGLILVHSSELDDLALAERLGRRAAAMGDLRGRRIAAEAVDKQNLYAGRPQKYGTQIGYSGILGKFRLEPFDPSTTDADREAMGVPPMAELEKRVEMLNQARAVEARRP